MMKHFFITICLALVAFAANAQTITDELRRSRTGEGTVVVHQSQEIDRLVNAVDAKQQAGQTGTSAHTQGTVPAGTQSATAASEPAKNAAPSAEGSASTAEGTGTAADTGKKIMRHSYKTTGYRIQIYSGGNKRTDRVKCEQIAQRVKGQFPNLPVYVHFYSPSWKCRAGNFTSQDEAMAVLKQIRAMGYSQACLVKGKINVQY
ncbi:MAG: SPOR domain-containing protein [Bacteroidales bacterium]|nr:SPOR domain-containing protein [Bacteroidales bacterium]MCM1147094.1 SPOR domain-containing protein [Bacteroidales bacterium]MCM1205772.1 SPOR domain-containing protein [Bacillota bacterium]MCM1511163.1 SPOR domain-containing protein [Clostridium sp.]